MTKPTSKFFVPEDFEDDDPQGTLLGSSHRYCASYLANKKLAKHLEGLPVVYEGEGQPDNWIPYVEHATRTAHLWGITPIQPEKCEHEPEFTNKIPGWHHGPDSEVQCRKCGAKLVAKWEEAGE